MKQNILKNERIFHFISLGLIAASIFLNDATQKFAVLAAGIVGLLFLSVMKNQRALITVYLVLLVAAGVAFYLIMTGNLTLDPLN